MSRKWLIMFHHWSSWTNVTLHDYHTCPASDYWRPAKTTIKVVVHHDASKVLSLESEDAYMVINEFEEVCANEKNEALEVKGAPSQLDHVNQISAPTFNCDSQTHVLKDCSLLLNPLASSQDQLNDAFQRQRNDPFAPTYNPEWTNHPNFS